MRGYRTFTAIRLRFTWFAMLLVVCNLGQSFAEAVDLPSISLTGNKRFSTHEILLALKVDHPLLSDVARTSESNDRTEAIVQSIQSGYVQCGNIDAKVSGEYSATNNAYHIRIDEGVAIQKKGIEVTGVEPELANRLCIDLKKPWRKQGEHWIPSLDAHSLLVREIGKEDSAGKEADVPGLGGDRYINPADFNAIGIRGRDAFARNGFSQAVFSIEERIDRSERKQTLVFRVTDLGSPTKIQEVRFAGLRRHDSKKLSEALGLRVGDAWTSQEMLRVQRALYESGRFQYHSVYALPPLFDPSQAIVVVQLIEADRLPLFYDPLSSEQERLRQAALDLTEAESGHSVFGEYFHSNSQQDLNGIKQAMFRTLVSEQGFVFRVGAHLDSIPFGYISIAGLPKADQNGKTTHLSFHGNIKAMDGPILRVAPFVLLEIEGGFKIDEHGRSVFQSSKGAITWEKEGSHVEKFEMSFGDEADGKMLRLSHLDSTETNKRIGELTNVGVRTSFVLRDSFSKISLFNDGKGLRHFSTGYKMSDWATQWKLLIANFVERILGADSDQYALIQDCILDQSRFASEFELKLAKYEESKSIGPISLALALYFSRDNRPQCIPLSELATKRVATVYIKAELEEFFARSELLRELTQALGNMIVDMPNEVIVLAKEFAPGNQVLSKLEPIIGNPSADFKELLIDQVCDSAESNKEFIGHWLKSFTPTSTAPVHRSANGTPQNGIAPAKGAPIQLPR